MYGDNEQHGNNIRIDYTHFKCNQYLILINTYVLTLKLKGPYQYLVFNTGSNSKHLSKPVRFSTTCFCLRPNLLDCR